MRILVTGGAGYIGSHTVRALIERGHDPIAFDNLSYGHREAVPADRLVIGDLNDVPLLERHLAGVDAVIHFAAFAYVGESVTNPAKYYANNLVNSLTLLDACRRHGLPRFVFSSTCATYGTPTRVPISEDQATADQPVRQHEARLRAGWTTTPRPFGFCALQYFNAAGAAGQIHQREPRPQDAPDPLSVQAAMGRRPRLDILLRHGLPTPDGTCIRDYIHVNDLAAAHIWRWKALAGIVGSTTSASAAGSSVRESDPAPWRR
ncbi:MAG: NAD-dependent epimerase/dehydratase family protein [Gemmataceae bacterium]